MKYPTERFDLKLDILWYEGRQIKFAVYAAVFLLFVVTSISLEPNPTTFGSVFTTGLMLLGLVSWILSGVYHLREKRALRILEAYQGLKEKLN